VRTRSRRRADVDVTQTRRPRFSRHRPSDIIGPTAIAQTKDAVIGVVIIR
jgi:hypothetical protein